MTIRISILLICIFGFALAPTVIFSCSSKGDNSCCKKETSGWHSAEKMESRACCKKGKQHSNDQDGCGGKRGDKSCQCPSFHVSLIPSFFQENTNQSFDFSDAEQKFSDVETCLSSGFYSIWTPPNIG